MSHSLQFQPTCTSYQPVKLSAILHSTNQPSHVMINQTKDNHASHWPIVHGCHSHVSEHYLLANERFWRYFWMQAHQALKSGLWTGTLKSASCPLTSKYSIPANWNQGFNSEIQENAIRQLSLCVCVCALVFSLEYNSECLAHSIHNIHLVYPEEGLSYRIHTTLVPLHEPSQVSAFVFHWSLAPNITSIFDQSMFISIYHPSIELSVQSIHLPI